jgi:ABC-type Fe3+-hydroxamate transport system substrate-binding protein
MNRASLTKLIEHYRDLSFYKNEILNYLKNNNVYLVEDDWFGNRSWRVENFEKDIEKINKELNYAY